MIRCHLGRLLGERKLKISDVATSTGIHRHTLTRLYSETAERVDLEVMDKLCAYFGVAVGELFEHVPASPIHK
ncbi:helix-turn-helix transcriptional regulator [Ramlibacter sp. RBP-2]|uniref:Helix-turn-helix transcriptional regulator n=1 Tax=Ramlibacter lithotrophicus TaxID=2606681 RepID=A0A7X6I903_9BURK|nr:helix-turn-helix transcriptional regulator [Ramlibacter lithotrophicus]NKE68905.1 helix-turn-helix transcriptional regulator [Ramlibacter lithotrophicus]